MIGETFLFYLLDVTQLTKDVFQGNNASVLKCVAQK